ncbi:MAG TPA: hypothetical protein VH277_01975 [Gemmatimonadaceae bacterium]|jgi:hypothetical protein|nr:hypothetical protein [Gemmatimonadaceae bacterium]
MTTTARVEMAYDAALDLIGRTLAGPLRRQILDAVTGNGSGDFAQALARLRAAMRTHTFPTGGVPLALERFVRTFDGATRAEGFHVLESWDYRAHRFSECTVPVLMLDRCASQSIPDDLQRQSLAVLLDQYFLSIIGLLAVRAWDDGDANANLDRVTALVAALNGEGGGGQRFVDDAETLLLVAISHYHPHEHAYDSLIERIWTLDDDHACRVATACAATLGSHLRWGHRFMYQRDVGRMRDDNVVDYPWLLFSLVTLMRRYVRAAEADERCRLSEALLNGLSADPWAFTGTLPRSLARFASAHEELRSALHEHRAALSDDLSRHRPARDGFTPLGFLCNFLCNAIVAMTATGTTGASDHPSLNDLFTAHGDAAAAGSYAHALASYATANGGRADGAALIVYDPYEGQSAYNMTLRVLGAL